MGTARLLPPEPVVSTTTPANTHTPGLAQETGQGKALALLDISSAPKMSGIVGQSQAGSQLVKLTQGKDQEHWDAGLPTVQLRGQREALELGGLWWVLKHGRWPQAGCWTTACDLQRTPENSPPDHHHHQVSHLPYAFSQQHILVVQHPLVLERERPVTG